MRTTLTLVDPLAKELQKPAVEAWQPFEPVVNETLCVGLLQQNMLPHPAYSMTPAAMGVPRQSVDLGKALQLADELEDAAMCAKLKQRT